MNVLTKIGKLTAVAACLMALQITLAFASTSTYSNAQYVTTSGSTFCQVSGTTITFTGGNGTSYINTGSGNMQLLGVSGCWVVSSTGGALSGITDNNCTISGSGKGNTSWTSQSGPTGYGGTSGFGNGTNYLQCASSSTYGQFGKTGSGYTSGVFNCYGIQPAKGVDVGVDCEYNDHGILKTGCFYFYCPGVSSVPEPSESVAMVLGMIMLAGYGYQRSRKAAGQA